MKNDLLERFTTEFAQLKDKPDILVSLSPIQIWVIMGNMQLALRHPDNKGGTSDMAREIALEFQALVASEGALKEVAEMGWLPEYDE
jgi:hypothetical protein